MFDALHAEVKVSGAHHADSRRSDVLHSDSRLLSRLVDFAVLSATFYFSCVILSIELGNAFSLLTLVYSSILFVFIRLSRRTVASYCKSTSETICQIIGNAAGILVGTCVVLLPDNIFSIRSEIFVAVILSGTMTFFVLGTLCPLVLKTSSGLKSSTATLKNKNPESLVTPTSKT